MAPWSSSTTIFKPESGRDEGGTERGDCGAWKYNPNLSQMHAVSLLASIASRTALVRVAAPPAPRYIGTRGTSGVGMASAHQSSETGVWSVEGHSIRVEYWASVLEEIRAAAVAGYCRFPKGGVEVGGVLFGRLEKGVTRILASRPAACEYKFGPSFHLSKKDDEAFGELLRATESDPLLAGLEPVGWYHSHTRSQVCLSEQDVDLHDRHFSKPSQVALVVKPESFGPSRAGFFFREADGTMRTKSSHGEFALAARSKRPRSPAKEANEPKAAPARAEAHPAESRAEPRAIPARAIPAPKLHNPAPRRSRPLFVRATATVLLITAAAVVAFLATRRTAYAPPSLALSALDMDGQLQIAWDRDSAAVRQASGGSLEIVDGNKRLVLPFTAAGLRRGSVTYARRSETVEVRLTVNPPDRNPVEELVRFVGAKPEAVEKPEVSPPKVEEKLPTPEIKRPERLRQKKQKARQRTSVSTPPRATGHNRTLRLGDPPRPPTRPLSQPQPLESRASTTLAATPRGEGIAAAPPPATASPRPAGHRGPTAGRTIWTGWPGRGQSLSIDGTRASAGSVPGHSGPNQRVPGGIVG
jgi:proteasome lid subunit RPN8/RPN11